MGLAWLLLISGCASDDYRDNYHFGNAVRHEIAIQTVNPGSSAYGLDGVKAVGALSAYQQNQGDLKSVDDMGLAAARDAGQTNP